MNIWNKVYLGLIFTAAIVVVALAAVELRVRNTGQKHIASLEKRVADTEDGIAKIVSGLDPIKLLEDKQPNEWSFGELQRVVFERYHARGRVWPGCIVASNPVERTLPPAMQQVEVQLIITTPLAAPSNTEVEVDVVLPETLKGLVYVFAENVAEDTEENGGAVTSTFLGRFNVDSEPVSTKFRNDEGNEINGWRVTLHTTDAISKQEIEQIFAAARLRWSIHLTPPVDSAERIARTFDPLTENGNDDQDTLEIELAQNFAAMLDWKYQDRSRFQRAIDVASSDITTFRASEEKNESENKKLMADCVLEERRAAAMVTQRDAVKDVLEQYEAEAAKLTLQVEKLQTLAMAYVDKIGEAQAKSIENMEEQNSNLE
jgi:hypothetical protein